MYLKDHSIFSQLCSNCCFVITLVSQRKAFVYLFNLNPVNEPKWRVYFCLMYYVSGDLSGCYPPFISKDQASVSLSET